MSVTDTSLPPYLDGPPVPAGRARRWRRSLARYELRLLPGGALAGAALLGVVWSFGSDIDSGTERTFLVVISTLALSLVFGDVAGHLTTPVPIPLRSRRVPIATMAVGIAGCGWVAARVGVPAVRGVDAVVTAADVLEWCTIALSQLTVASVMARRIAVPSVGPGLVAAMLWASATSNPRVHDELYDVSQHPGTWAVLVAVFLLVGSLASTDPAHRRFPTR